MTENKQVATTTATLSPAERFTAEVTRQFGNSTGTNLRITPFQKQLIQNYFIKLDSVLKAAEVKRMCTKEQYRDSLEYIWKNVNLEKLAQDAVHYASIDLDPLQKNHVFLIPYKNNKTQKFDINFTIGYIGEGIKAKKYGVTDQTPDNVIVEVVYSTDEYKEYKRDRNNKVENYDFKITKPFDRGAVIGGFYYHEYFNEPAKNKLVSFSKADIDKRRPANASPEFWGGEKDKWENNRVVGKETIEGWYDEMAYKTIYRAAYGCIPIDSEKIDIHYTTIMDNEQSRYEETIKQEIRENANKEAISFNDEEQYTDAEIVHTVTPAPEPAKETAEDKPPF